MILQFIRSRKQLSWGIKSRGIIPLAKASACHSDSSGQTEQVASNSFPPGFNNSHKLSRILAEMTASSFASSGLRSQRMSGCRLIMPDAVQGTSARMQSNALPSHQFFLEASPAIMVACNWRRVRFSSIFFNLSGSLSSACKSISAISSIWPDLPPVRHRRPVPACHPAIQAGALPGWAAAS